jgi:site-specific recombinase XerD
MWNEIAAWQEKLNFRPGLSAKTTALYTQDARRFATWLQQEYPGLKATQVTPTDAKTYRDHLLAKRYAPTTINRALISLMLFFDTIDGTNPFRNLTMIDIVEPAPVALSKTEWNAVRRCAEQAARRDHGLAFALATLFRYAGPRVSEVAALLIPDVQISARRGLLIIRRGKGLKHREIPLVQEARDPLDAYFNHREQLAEHWRERARVQGETVTSWSRWLYAAFVRSLPNLVKQQNSLRLSALTIFAIRLPNHSLILLPMDWTALRCRFQPFNNCWATPISRQPLFIHGFLLMILPV